MGMGPTASPEDAQPPPGGFPAPSPSPHRRMPDPSLLQRENRSLGSSIRPFFPLFPLDLPGNREQGSRKQLHSRFIFLPFPQLLGDDGLTAWKIPAFPQHPSLFDTQASEKKPLTHPKFPVFFNHSSHQVGKQPRKRQENRSRFGSGAGSQRFLCGRCPGKGGEGEFPGFFVPPRQRSEAQHSL